MGTLNENARINRRRFLQIAGLTAGGAVLTPLLARVKPGGGANFGRRSQFYRSNGSGKLLGSADGQEWVTLANFGPHLTVAEVQDTGDGWVRSTLVVESQSFVLKSRDEKTWYTEDYSAPGQA